MLAPVVSRHGLATIIKSLFCIRHSVFPEIINNYFNYDQIYFRESGKQALYEILLQLKCISTRTKVIVQAYTCYSVAKVIVDSGLDLHIIDTDPTTLDFNCSELRAAIDNNTLCIIATHLFGKSANLEKVKELIANEHIYLVEDAAQKQMSDIQENSIADVTIYSFGRGKPISLMGGGIVGINNLEIGSVYEKYIANDNIKERLGIKVALKMLINDTLTLPLVYTMPASLPILKIGKTIYPESIESGSLSRYQKCYLTKKLAVIHADYLRRKELASIYTRKIANMNSQNMIVHTISKQYAPHRYPFYTNLAIDGISHHIYAKARKLGVVQMYPTGIHKLPQITKLNPKVSACTGTEYVSSHLMTAPTHIYVNKRNLSLITDLFDVLL